MAFYRSPDNRKPMGYVGWFLMFFNTSEIICFKKNMRIFFNFTV